MMDTRECANFARIACLTMQEGTQRVRAKTLNNIAGSLPFHDVLPAKESHFKILKKKGIISKIQYNLLFPSTGRVHLSNIDMTLWLILARNLTVGSRYIRWTEYPADKQILWQHDAIRLKEIRNRLFHLKTPELSNREFLEFKVELVSALRRLGSPDEVIQDYFTLDLDPEQTKTCCMQVREQCLEEMHQVWLTSVHQKRQMRNVAILLAVLTVLVAVAIVTSLVLFFDKAAPCASSIEERSSDSGVLKFMKRAGWGALPRRNMTLNSIPLLKKPVKKAVLFNTKIDGKCDVTADCCSSIKSLQARQYKSRRVHWQDISYNFLIGDDGVVYEGRGAYYIGAAAWHHNDDIVSIGFMGNFICNAPSRAAIMALYVFLEWIQHSDPSSNAKNHSEAILAQDYRIYGHCQINLQTLDHNFTFADSPGAAFMREIRMWNRLSQENMTHCRLDVDCMRPPDCCTPCSLPYSTMQPNNRR